MDTPESLTALLFHQIISTVIFTEGAEAISQGSFENKALENEDRSPKHPKLENEAP